MTARGLRRVRRRLRRARPGRRCRAGRCRDRRVPAGTGGDRGRAARADRPVNATGTALTAALGLAGAAVCHARLIVPASWRARTVGVLLGLSGVAGLWAGVAALSGQAWRRRPARAAATGRGPIWAVDALSGWFLLLIGSGDHRCRDLHHRLRRTRRSRPPAPDRAMATLPLFTAFDAARPGRRECADVSAVLGADGRHLAAAGAGRTSPARPRVRPAAIWYAAMTQAGFVGLLLGLLWLAAAAGRRTFAGIRAMPRALSPAVKGAVFLLCLFGFASKAGAVPLHPWLPRAHAEAPSHVSALMSAAMVKLGVYGILRLGFDLLGGGPRWWWLIVAALGALSALYGIMQAVVATDLKRLLAFSTSREHRPDPARGRVRRHVRRLRTGPRPPRSRWPPRSCTPLNHAGFKTLLFLGAGSVVKATGTRDLDRLGGLSRTHARHDRAGRASARSRAAALPPGNGFVSEWLLLQSLLQPGRHGHDSGDRRPGRRRGRRADGRGRRRHLSSKPSAPDSWRGRAAVPPRQANGVAAEHARGDGPGGPRLRRTRRRTGDDRPGDAAGRRATCAWRRRRSAPSLAELRLTGITARFWPLWLAVPLVALTARAVAVLGRRLGRARRRAIAWDCGDGPLTARMEYTATSYRRTAAAGLRRRSGARARRRRHSRRRNRPTTSRRSATGSASPTGSRTGSTGRSSTRSAASGEAARALAPGSDAPLSGLHAHRADRGAGRGGDPVTLAGGRSRRSLLLAVLAPAGDRCDAGRCGPGWRAAPVAGSASPGGTCASCYASHPTSPDRRRRLLHGRAAGADGHQPDHRRHRALHHHRRIAGSAPT